MGYKFNSYEPDNISNRSSVNARWQKIGQPRSVLRSNSENGSGDAGSNTGVSGDEDVCWDDVIIEPDNSFKLNKKKLFPEELAKFKRIGKPDLDQNWLELFSPELVSDLFTIMDYGSDNYEKANYILDELKEYGFYEIGEGTNILVVANDRYPGVVFKIALDHNGIADNFNDELLQRVVPHYTRVFARHSTGIISVQEYSVTMTKERMSQFYPKIIKLLERLSKQYLIADLSPSRFLNFGINRQGDFIIQDGSDLYPLDQLIGKFRCKNPTGWDQKHQRMKLCGGKLEYSADYLVLRCKDCGHEINPLELRPNEKEEQSMMANIMCDGTSSEQRDAMEQEELRHLMKSNGMDSTVDVQVKVSDPVMEEPEVDDDTTPDIEADDLIEDSQEDTDDTEEVETDTVSDDSDEEDVGPEEEHESDIQIEHNGSVFEEPPQGLPDEEDAGYEPAEDPEDSPVDDIPTIDLDRDVKAEKSPEPDTDVLVKSLADKLRQMNQSGKDKPVVEDKPCKVETTVIPVTTNDENGSVLSAGIYLNITGDFHEAWDKDGLPIFVSIDNGQTYDLAISSRTMETLLAKVVDMIKVLAD